MHPRVAQQPDGTTTWWRWPAVAVWRPPRARRALGWALVAGWAAGLRLHAVPDEVSRDLTHFTTDPRPLLAHRQRIAAMIEQLHRSL